jgi:hypothetical protein
MDNGKEIKETHRGLRRSADGSLLHPSHGTFHIVRLVAGSILGGISFFLVIFVLGFLGTLDFIDSFSLAAKIVLLGGAVLGITLGIIFSILAAILIHLIPALKKNFHPLALVRSGFLFLTLWPLLSLIAWPMTTIGVCLSPIISLVFAVMAAKMNPHADLIPHRTSERIIGTSTGPMLLLLVLIALTIPIYNRGFGPHYPAKLIVVAVDGLDQIAYNELINSPDGESLDNLSYFREFGVAGSITPVDGIFPDRIWADMFTGTTESTHNILDRNSTADNLNAEPVWEFLAGSDFKVGAFQMSPPHPGSGSLAMDVPAPGRKGSYNHPVSATITMVDSLGGRQSLPSLFEAANTAFLLARLGVSFDTLVEIARRAMAEYLLDISPRVKYMERKDIQFMIQSDIALASMRTNRLDMVFLRFPAFSRIMKEYRIYYRPSEYGNLPLDVSASDAVGLANAIPDVYRNIDNFLSRLYAFKNHNTVVMIVSNHGVKTGLRVQALKYPVSPERLLDVSNYQTGVLTDFNNSAMTFRVDGAENQQEAINDLAQIFREAEWFPENSAEISETRGRQLFSVTNLEDRMEVTIVGTTDLLDTSLVTIAGWQGELRDLYRHGSPETSLTSAPGVFLASGPMFRPGSQPRMPVPYDIASTILHVMGFPVYNHMVGRPLDEIIQMHWTENHPVEFADWNPGKIPQDEEEPANSELEEIDENQESVIQGDYVQIPSDEIPF